MSNITSIGGNSVSGAQAAQEQIAPQRSKRSEGTLPPTQNTQSDAVFTSDLPTLPKPLMACGLALETLVNAVGNKERQQATQDGLDRLQQKATEQADTNQEKLEKIREQLDEMASKKVLNGFLKAFQIIGMIIGAVAAVATLAAGCMTGNPLLIAGAVVGMAMLADGITSIATDGEHSISAAITNTAVKNGMNPEDAQWLAFGVQMGMMAVSLAFSLGAAATTATSSVAKLGADVAEKACKAISTLTKVQQGLQIASSINTVGTGAATIASATIDYKINLSQADAKELEAILEQIRQAMNTEEDLLKAEVERASDLMTKVSDIVKNCQQTTAAIAQCAPTMA